jgi:hypothetical protein
MSDEMTEQEAQKLFNEVGKALKDDDNVKLTELMTAEITSADETETKEVVEETRTETKEEVKEKTEASKETPANGAASTEAATETKEVKKTPPIKAESGEQKDTTKVVEVSEADKLKEQLAKLSKENHDLRSQAGRVPHVQRKIQELDKKLAELAKANSTPSSQPSAKIKPEVDELLKGIKETDPDLANAIAKAIGKASDAVTQDTRAKETETLQFLRNQEYQTYQAAEASRLLELYPNAVAVFKSPSWTEWKQGQSARIAGLADSDTADDVAVAFNKYTADMIQKYPDLAKSQTHVEATPSQAASESAAAAQKVEAERQRKLKTSANVGSPNAAGKVGMPDDPGALFAKYSEEIRKQRTG